jgi:hypothetical protein
MFANASRARSDIVCPTCNRMLWWRSRTGRRVCMVCYPDPLQALEVLSGTTQQQMVQAPGRPYKEVWSGNQVLGAV